MLPVLSRRVTKPEPINADMFITLQYVTVKIKIAETIIFPTVTYGSESWTVRKKDSRNHNIPDSDIRKWELDSAEKGKEKNWCFYAVDVEKNFMSSLDKEENKPFSFGGRETEKITWSDNPPIKVT